MTILLLLSLALGASLGHKELAALKFRIALLESRGLGDTRAENRYGYLGRYQFGAAALVEVGLMKRERYDKCTHVDPAKKRPVWNQGCSNLSFINDVHNWNLPDGKESFLGNETVQEKAMDTLLNKHYNQLKKKGIRIYKKERMMGFLMAAHLGGFNNALAYLRHNKEYRDGLGTKISSYFKAAGNRWKSDTAQREEIVALGKKYLGGKYVWGGTNPAGFDCSGYVRYIFGKQGIKLPRTAYAQSKVGKAVPQSKLQKGDLIFFNTDPSRGIPVTHVGVYLENGKFIHAANKKKGITISTLESYRQRFVTAKRVFGTGDIPGMQKVYPSRNNRQLPIGFFRTDLDRALRAPTGVTLDIRSSRYRYVGGRYIREVDSIPKGKIQAEEQQLW